MAAAVRAGDRAYDRTPTLRCRGSWWARTTSHLPRHSWFDRLSRVAGGRPPTPGEKWQKVKAFLSHNVFTSFWVCTILVLEVIILVRQ